MDSFSLARGPSQHWDRSATRWALPEFPMVTVTVLCHPLGAYAGWVFALLQRDGSSPCSFTVGQAPRACAKPGQRQHALCWSIDGVVSCLGSHLDFFLLCFHLRISCMNIICFDQILPHFPPYTYSSTSPFPSQLHGLYYFKTHRVHLMLSAWVGGGLGPSTEA